MENKYIATIMRRNYIGPDNYIFSFDHIVFGEYNEKSKIFTDQLGNEYYYMMNSSALTMDVPYAAYNIEEIAKIMEKDPKITSKRMMLDYVKDKALTIYHVGYTSDYTPYKRTINLADDKTKANDIQNSDDIKKDTVIERLETIIQEIATDKFNEEELKRMLDSLMDVKLTIEDTISTIEIGIDAINNKRKYVDEMKYQLDNPTEEEKPVESPKKDDKKNKKTKTSSEKLAEDIKKRYSEKDSKEDELECDRIPIDEVCKEINKAVISQEEPVHRLVTEIAIKEMIPSECMSAILLLGETGSGKTEIMRQLRKALFGKRKVYIVDTTQITSAGYTGADIAEILYKVYEYCKKNIKDTERSIIFFDEVDKKGSDDNSDVAGRGVLNSLLPFIEGTTYTAAEDTKTSTKTVEIDTTNMIVVLGGAFADVLKNLSEKNEIGFGKEMNSLDKPKCREVTTEDFVKYGRMPDELMGRVLVIRLNTLEREDLKKIILESEESALNKRIEAFKKLGVKLTYTSEYIEKVVDEAYALKTGARALSRIISKTTWHAFSEVHEHAGQYSEVILGKETVEESSHYQLIKK